MERAVGEVGWGGERERKEEEEVRRGEGKPEKKHKKNTSHSYKVQTQNDIISTLYSLLLRGERGVVHCTHFYKGG